MSVRIMADVWELEIEAAHKFVLLALADNANDNGHCWPSIATIARKCGKSERAVQGAIKELVERGHLTRKEVYGRGCNYIVHPRRICTPAESAPPQNLHHTPAESAPKPSRTIIGLSSDKPKARAREKSVAAAKVNPYPCPHGVDEVDWQGLLANRKAKRAPMTEAAYRSIVGKLQRWADAGWPPGPIVREAAERGWTSVFETDSMKGNRHGDGKQGDGIGRTAKAALAAFGNGAGGSAF